MQESHLAKHNLVQYRKTTRATPAAHARYADYGDMPLSGAHHYLSNIYPALAISMNVSLV